MKLHPDDKHASSVTGYGSGWIAVNGKRHVTSLILHSSEGAQTWDCSSFAELNASHFEALAQLDIEMLIVGSGERFALVPPALLVPFYQRRIGVECMDTPAACRTYNFLAAEGRKLAAALLL